jgi:hypothetical protein
VSNIRDIKISNFSIACFKKHGERGHQLLLNKMLTPYLLCVIAASAHKFNLHAITF